MTVQIILANSPERRYSLQTNPQADSEFKLEPKESLVTGIAAIVLTLTLCLPVSAQRGNPTHQSSPISQRDSSPIGATVVKDTRYEQVIKADDISATIVISSSRPGEPEPPTLLSTNLRVVLSRGPDKDKPKWQDMPRRADSSDLDLSARASPTAISPTGEQTKESYDKKTQFITFIGKVGDLKDLDHWKNAWIQAHAIGTMDDAQWQKAHDNRARASWLNQYRDIYKLPREQKVDGQPLGINAVLYIYVNGTKAAQLTGTLIEQHRLSDNQPYVFSVNFLPCRLQNAPVLLSKQDANKNKVDDDDDYGDIGVAYGASSMGSEDYDEEEKEFVPPIRTC